jgi:hypothetical protein
MTRGAPFSSFWPRSWGSWHPACVAPAASTILVSPQTQTRRLARPTPADVRRVPSLRAQWTCCPPAASNTRYAVCPCGEEENLIIKVMLFYRDSFRVAIRSLRGVAQARAPAPRDWCCCMCVYLAACCIYEESDDEGEDKKPLDADFDVEAARCRKL